MALTCKTSLSNLQIGNYLWCKYTATSGAFGTFSDFATKTDSDVGSNVIPVASSATPNGYFKWIFVGYDTRGRLKLVADRVVQHSISWDNLNTAGIASGSGLPIWTTDKKHNCIVRLMTGGTSVTDTDNEWNKIIVESNLNGTITSGDNNVWNWSGLYSWTSTSIATNTARRIRGGATLSTYGDSITSSVATNIGFRPILLIETLITNKYLIKQNTNYYSIKSEFYDVGSYTPLTLEGGTTPNDNDFINNGIEDLNDLLVTNANGVVISSASTLGTGNVFSFSIKSDLKNIINVK